MRFALVLLTVLAVAAPAGAARPATIRVWSVPTSNQLTDVSPKGLSAGDVVRQRTQLLNAVGQFGKRAGAVVGYDTSVLRFSSAKRATVATSVHLPGGTLSLRAVVTVGSGITARVVSGTGTFAGARGTVTEVDDARANRALNVYRLTYGAVA